MNENKGEISLLGVDPVGTHMKCCESPQHVMFTTILENTFIKDQQEGENNAERGEEVQATKKMQKYRAPLSSHKHMQRKKDRMTWNYKYYEEGSKDELSAVSSKGRSMWH